MLPRFLVSPDHLTDKTFTLTGSEARHAALVLRKKPGELIELFDGKDQALQGRIDAVSNQEVRGVIVARQAAMAKRMALTLCQGLLKGPKWEWLIEKACEIGVERLVPVISRRTVVQPASGHREA